MKKLVVLAMVMLLSVMLIIPVSALDWYKGDITNAFDVLPDMYKDAKYITLGEFWQDGATNARHGNVTGQLNDFDYIYLKADDKGDFVIPFTVPEDGLYEFGFVIMGWTKSVLRTTNVKIDDAPNVYIGYDYEEDNQYHNHYWYGISAILTAGEHKLTLSLADDFDDSTVKSLYFSQFFYVEGDLPIVEEAAPEDDVAPAVEEAPAPAVEEAAPAPAAPQTFDITVLAVAALAASGLVVFKKRR